MNNVRNFKEKHNPWGKPTNASILRKLNNTNIQRILSKQNIAESSRTDQFPKSLLINKKNKRGDNKPKSTASPTSNADNENMQNPRENLEEEIKRLTNEVASLKKDHLTPPCVNRYGGKLYQLHHQNRHHRRLSRTVTITK